MGFTQITFLFFFMPVCILLYLAAYRLSGKDLRVCNGVLVIEGLVFYWWAEPKLLLFFVVLTILIYSLGNRMYNTESKKEKKGLLIITIIIFVLLPVIYKYLPSLDMPNGAGKLRTLPLFRGVLVPLGISFFSLEAISYIVDVYTDRTAPGRLMDVSVFMMLFPKAVCGPVVLWRDFSPQAQKRKVDTDDVSAGLKRIIIGYAKKAIIADTFAVQIVLIGNKMSSGGTDVLSAWILGLLYFFRIYYDFSGYSDIAIGLMKIFGFKFGENFDRPYLSGSLTDFWRRWHISLGRWFREYIYIPLGGSRKGNVYINVFITFIIAALWHGWKWNILLWGALNGLIVMAEKTLIKRGGRKRMPRTAGIALTVILVYFGWMLFRASDISTAGEFFKALVIPTGGSVPNFTWQFFMTKRITVFLVIAAAGAFGAFSKLSEIFKAKMNSLVYEILEDIVLLALFAFSIMFVLGTSYTPFIYSSF